MTITSSRAAALSMPQEAAKLPYEHEQRRGRPGQDVDHAAPLRGRERRERRERVGALGPKNSPANGTSAATFELMSGS
jgi:hypothetical protein